MPKKQKDKPPEGYFGGGSGITSEEALRRKYPDLKEKYDLYIKSQSLILLLRSEKLELNKKYPSFSDYAYGTLKWLIGDTTESKKYLKLQRLNKLILAATTRSNRRLYSYNILSKLLME